MPTDQQVSKYRRRANMGHADREYNRIMAGGPIYDAQGNPQPVIADPQARHRAALVERNRIREGGQQYGPGMAAHAAAQQGRPGLALPVQGAAMEDVMPANVNRADVTFQGAPTWYAQLIHRGLQESAKNAQTRRVPYGEMSADEVERVRAAEAVLDHLPSPLPNGKYWNPRFSMPDTSRLMAWLSQPIKERANAVLKNFWEHLKNGDLPEDTKLTPQELLNWITANGTIPMAPRDQEVITRIAQRFDQALNLPVAARYVPPDEQARLDDERQVVQGTLDNIRTRHQTLAPFNEEHERVAQMIQEGTEEPEVLQLARQSMKQAARGSPKLEKATMDYLRNAAQNPEDIAHRYRDAFQQEVIQDMGKEAREAFERQAHVPGLAFLRGKAYNSGAREKAERQHRFMVERALARDITKLKSLNHEQSLQHAEKYLESQRQNAEMARRANETRQMNLLRTSEQGRNLGAVEQQRRGQNIQLHSQLAQQKQQQRQNEIGVQRAAHERAQAAPQEALEQHMAMVYRNAPPQQMAINYRPAEMPAAPSGVMNVLGALNALGGHHGGYGNPSGHYRGGHVKRYQGGGYVMPNFNEVAQQAQPLPQEHQVGNMAQQLQNYQFNPKANLMTNMGINLLKKSPGRHMQAMGQAFADSKLDRTTAQNKSLDYKKDAGDLYDKINKSRLDQQKYLADYESHKANHDYHMKHLGEMRRHNLASEDLLREKSGSIPKAIQLGETTINLPQHKQLSAPDKKHLQDIEDSIEEDKIKAAPYQNAIKFINTAKETGVKPATGVLAHLTPDISQVNRDYSRALENIVKSSAGEDKGQLTKEKLKTARRSKPTQMDTLDASLNYMKEKLVPIENRIEKNKAALRYSTYQIPPAITLAAYDVWEKEGKDKPLDEYVKMAIDGNLPTVSEPKKPSPDEPQSAEPVSEPQSAEPVKVIRMKKNGQFYRIPADEAEQARREGYIDAAA